jgi:hypothetical protein
MRLKNEMLIQKKKVEELNVLVEEERNLSACSTR